jgi:hypothetical protein
MIHLLVDFIIISTALAHSWVDYQQGNWKQP